MNSTWDATTDGKGDTSSGVDAAAAAAFAAAAFALPS
jgi:hypothetical protein